MKATLEFNLPDEQEEFNQATKASAYISVLCDYANALRSVYKYSQNEDEVDAANKWAEKFWEICRNHNIDPWSE